MAISLSGIGPQGTPRIRILLAICELQQIGAPASYSAIQRRVDLSSGSMTHHLRELEHDGLVTHAENTRAFTLTAAAISAILLDGWLIIAHSITVVLSTKALELLETAPATDDDPSPHQTQP